MRQFRLFSTMSTYLTITLLALGLLGSASRAFGQNSSASVTGIVNDSSGADVAGASVTLTSVDTSVEHKAVTNGSGNYVFLDIPPGRYKLSVVQAGFQTQNIAPFELTVNQTATFNTTLNVGEIQTSVTVEAEGVGVESSTAELGTVIGKKAVNDLPLNGRNFTQLLTLTPGVIPISVAQNANASNTPVVLNSSFTFPSVNGQGNRSNYFLVDGMNDQNSFYNTYAVAPIVDTIQEFKVNSHNDAQFGQVTGGVINVATKAGTESYHGTGWEFLRNTIFDARPFFSTAPVVPFHQNQYGGAVGGPVTIPRLYDGGKKKTFFFVSAEGYHHTNAVAGAYFKVPTAAELTGDYDDLYQQFGSRGLLIDPKTQQPYPVVNGKHNQIQSELDPGAVAYVKAVLPAPQVIPGQASNNAQTVGNETETQVSYSGRIDQTIGSKDFVFFRYAGQDLDHTVPNEMPSLLTQTEIPSQQYGFSWLHVFSGNKSLEFVYGRSHVEANTATLFTSRDVAGIYGLDPASSAYGDGNTYMSNITVTDYFTGGESSNPTKDVSNIHQYKATYAMALGNHSLQAGGSWDQINFGSDLRLGTLGFGALQTGGTIDGVTYPGDSSASFLIGYPNNATKRNVAISERPGGIMSFYLQDSWKATPRLTLNYGLRYDRTFIPAYGKPGTETQNGGIATGDFNFRDGTYIVQVLPALCSVQLVAPCLPGDGTLPAHVTVSPDATLLHDTKTNFGPRFGFAYRVTQRMAIRGSFGIFYDNWSASTQLPQNFQGAWPDVGTLNTGVINSAGTPYVSPHSPFGSTAGTLPATTPFGSNNVNYFVDPYIRNPYSEQYNLGIEQELAGHMIASINYVGSVSHRLDIGGYYNTGMPSPLPFGSPARANQVGLNGPQANGQLFGYTVPNKWDRAAGNGTYNALQTSLAKSFSNGLAYTIAYTWSKVIDEGQSGYFGVEGNSLQDPYNVRGSRGVAAYNIPQLFSAAVNYELPVGRGKQFVPGNKVVSYILGNWQINSIVIARSGQNFTMSAAGDIANTGNANTYVRANVVGNAGLTHPTASEWFNTAAFVTPAAGSIGNAGRDNYEAQRYVDMDLSVFRKFPIHDLLQAELRAEGFNVLNHPVFGIPGSTVNSPVTFGVITTTAIVARTLQFAAKLTF